MSKPNQEKLTWFILGLGLLGFAIWRLSTGMTGIRLNNPTGELASSTGIASSPSSASNPSSSELPKPDSTPQTSPSTNATSNPSTDPDKSTEATPDKPDPENWDLDDGGRLAIISPRSLMLVLSVTGRGAKLESLHLKPIPYRQNNAHVRSPYSIAILDASSKTLFRAPVEVDNLCTELGPDHFEDHCIGDIVYPHEAGAIFRIPILAEASQILLLRQINGLDTEELELARMPLSLPPDALKDSTSGAAPQDPK